MYPENMETPAAKSANKLPDELRTIEELAALQGVLPVADYRKLLGHPSPEDETEEEFAGMLREWRSEGASEKTDR